ncbi:MAG: hypothetical protein DMG96_36115 [Acidobacteria bacterium]|nr:MAG: hypothetical protein DMG96_36115 [Acidobacteriota bacterium]
MTRIWILPDEGAPLLSIKTTARAIAGWKAGGLVDQGTRASSRFNYQIVRTTVTVTYAAAAPWVTPVTELLLSTTMSTLEMPLMAFIKRACVLLDPHPVVVKVTPKTDSPIARGASFQRITLRSWEDLFVVCYIRTDALQNEESC